MLNRIADAVEAQDARLAELETFDTGLPITQALGQAQRAAENFRFFADLIVAQNDDAFKVPGTPAQLRQPQADRGGRADHAVEHAVHAGDAGSSPRRWPPAARWCSSPPSSRRCRPACWADDLRARPACRDGVFNLVNGIGEEAGDALVKHPGVPLISFTGESTHRAASIFANAAPFLKGLSMELGGKSPAVVFADADLDAADRLDPVRRVLAERRAVHGRLAGSWSSARIYDEFVSATPTRAARHRRRRPARSRDRGRRARAPRALRQGDGLRRDRQDRGPAASPAAAARTTCRRATTWRRPCSPTSPPERGSSRRRSSARSSPSPRSTDEAEALELANGVRYGLAAYIWTSDLTRAHTLRAERSRPGWCGSTRTTSATCAPRSAA